MQETEGRPVHGPSTEHGVSGWKDQASTKAKELAGQAESAAEAKKGQVATRVEGMAHAVRRAGEEDERLSRYTDAIGGQLEDVADYIQQHDLRDMLRSTSDFAHRQPALFLGGAFTLGLFVARFFKSSSSHEQLSDEEEGRSMEPSHDEPRERSPYTGAPPWASGQTPTGPVTGAPTI